MKAEFAVIKAAYWTQEEARQFEQRLCRVVADIAVLKADVAILKEEVADLKKQVDALRIDVAELSAQVVAMNARMDTFATKAELLMLESRLKAWMLTTTFTVITVTSGIQVALYTAFRP